LFSIGGLFSIYEGVHKFAAPEPLNKPWIAVGVLVFGLVAEAFSMWGCLREVNKVRNGRSLWRWFRESRSGELIVIFGEDAAALVGLALALLAVLATIITGTPLFDAIGTLAIGVLLVIVAVLVAIEVKALLIGQGVDPMERERMLAFLHGREEIDTVMHLVTLQMGNDVLVSVKAKMVRVPSDLALIDAINAVEKDLKTAFVNIRWSFFEPDVSD
ncbi:MAG: cation transporter, partial [Xanthomonadales bacterium]|nr:cation transporter [Xanthomonadales bacterium]